MYLAHAHGGGHVGIGKTIKDLTRAVWWPHLAEEVAAFVAGCLLCQCLRSKRSVPGQGSLERDRFNELVSLDFIGPRNHNGEDLWGLILIDHCTRFAAGLTTDSPCAQVAWDFLRLRWIPYFGNPALVLTDNSPFGKDFKAILRRYGIQHITALPHHPQGNGVNESSHRIIEFAFKTRVPRTEELFEDLLQ